MRKRLETGSIASLMLLYNILVAYWFSLPDQQASHDLRDLVRATVTSLWPQLDASVGWFVCKTENCDPYPFRMTPKELEDAELVICCDTCGHFCHWQMPPPPMRTPVADEFRKTHPNHPN